MLEEDIRQADATIAPETLLADAELPGVGDDAMSLREAMRIGGARTLTIIGLLGVVELMDGGVFNVLAPDIQKSLNISDAVLGAIGGATGVLFVLGAIPMSSLSDRMSRKQLVAITMTIWSVIIMLTGAVQNVLQMFLVRLGAGLGQSASLPVSAPLLIDAYPIPARSRVFAVLGGAQAIGTMIAPFLAGAIAALGSGGDGWRLPFILLGLIALPIALSATTIKEPRRGRYEMQSVLGEELPDVEDELPDLVVGGLRAAAPDPELLLLPGRHGRPRVRPVQRPAVPQPLLRRGPRARRLPARRDRHGHRHSRR